MVNEGIKTDALNLIGLVTDPDVKESNIVSIMRLPASLSVETLAVDEMKAISPFLDTWSPISGMDMRELFLRNSSCKRALYISAPIFLPDSIRADEIVGAGVNERIHVYSAENIHDTIRLEAVSSYMVGPFRFRYALSIQYMHDSVGLGWQLIRPVVIIDRELLAAVAQRGARASAGLQRITGALARLIAFGSHDYIHATVLNWFPPPRQLPPEYVAIMSERPHPPELDDWHAGSQTPLPAGLAPSVNTPSIATLELYSLMAHAQVIERIWRDDSRARHYIIRLVAEFGDALEQILAARPFRSEGSTELVADYFMVLAGWFLLSALPLRTARFTEAMAVLPHERVERACKHLAAVHGGMFYIVPLADPDRFPWRGSRVPLHQVAMEYATALRWPAVGTHLDFLLGNRLDQRGSARTWMDALCSGLPAEDRAGLAAGLEELSACRTMPGRGQVLARLNRSGQLGLLRSLGRPVSAQPRSGESPASLSYAHAVLTSLAGIIDDLLKADDGVLPSCPARSVHQI